MIVYKIRNKNNSEQFLTGTPAYHHWDKTGRLFQTIGKLRSFLTTSMKGRHNASNWDIVEFEMVEQAVKGVHEIITPAKLIELIKR
jgi:hypothetical protein